MRRYKDGRVHFNAEDIATFNRFRNKEGSVPEVVAHIERNKAAKRKRAQKRLEAFLADAEANGGVENDPEVIAFREIQDDLGIRTSEVFRALPTIEIKPMSRRPRKPTTR